MPLSFLAGEEGLDEQTGMLLPETNRLVAVAEMANAEIREAVRNRDQSSVRARFLTHLKKDTSKVALKLKR
jgi:hypothetical protein